MCERSWAFPSSFLKELSFGPRYELHPKHYSPVPGRNLRAASLSLEGIIELDKPDQKARVEPSKSELKSVGGVQETQFHGLVVHSCLTHAGDALLFGKCLSWLQEWGNHDSFVFL